MNDMELESLLQDAGYQYDPPSGKYLGIGDESELTVEEIADELEIPLNDLLRWQAEMGNDEDARQ